ncbi:MAG: hypothetical protein M1570_08685 [Chloroflexi bacterium]|nr:hypothetical protein [Chloroflexota bacterium]
MNEWTVLLLLPLFLAACSAALPAPNSSPTPPAASAPGRKPVLITAHRGGAGLAPENTLASFRNGIALGADYIEMDVHLSKDGSVVVIHDPTIDRTTDGAGRVSDYTTAELQKWNAAAKFAGATSRESIPTFAQVLDLAQPTNVKVEVEIKVDATGKPYPGIEQKVLDELGARGMLDRVKIMAFEWETLKRVKAINPRVTIIALMNDYLRSHGPNNPAPIIDDVTGYGADGIGANKDLLTAALTDAAHAHKMLVGVWTPDTKDEMLKAINMGVDSITTNHPDLLKKVLGRQ